MPALIARVARVALIAGATTLPLACGGGGAPGIAAFAEADLKDAAITGKFFRLKFTLDSGQVTRIEATAVGTTPSHPETWVVSLHNYPWSCAGNAELPPASGLIVTFGLEAPAPDKLIHADFGDLAAATLQQGVGTRASDANTRPAQKGLILLETWSTEVGAEISGRVGIRTKGWEVDKPDWEVNGSFKATICN